MKEKEKKIKSVSHKKMKILKNLYLLMRHLNKNKEVAKPK